MIEARVCLLCKKAELSSCSKKFVGSSDAVSEISSTDRFPSEVPSSIVSVLGVAGLAISGFVVFSANCCNIVVIVIVHAFPSSFSL